MRSNAVHSVQQDNKGFIWVISSNHLQRYDGHRFRTFTSGMELPEGVINAMVIDKKNRVWLQIGEKTVGWLHADDFRWHPATVQLPAHINARHPFLYLTKDDQLLLMYQQSGILGYDEKTNTLHERYNPFTLPQGWKIIMLWQDPQKNYWIGTQNGLVKYNPSTRKMSYAGNNAEDDSTIEQFRNVRVVNMFYIDKQNRKWLGSWPKETGISLKSLDPDGRIREWEPRLASVLKSMYHTVFSIIETGDGTWMYGTNLLAKIDASQNRISPLPSDMPGEYSIRYDIISQVMTDRENNLWLSTNKGLYYFNPASHVFQTRFNRLPAKDSFYTSDITAFLQTRNGDVLVSTWGNGVFTYDSTLVPASSRIFTKSNGLGEGMVWSITEDRNGSIWWGKQDGWLARYDPSTGRTMQWQVPFAEKRTIRQVVADASGNIWLGTQGGHIIFYDPGSNNWQLIHKAKGVIGRLYSSSRNEIWAATDFDGLYRIKANGGKVLSHYTEAGPSGKRINNNGVADILEYDANTMLILSNGLNILNLARDSMAYLFPGMELFNLAKDNKGRIWISSSGKIISFWMNRQGMHYSFDERDGLDNVSFNMGASITLQNGQIVFGTSHSMVLFDPEKAMNGTKKRQDLEVSALAVNDKELSVDSTLRLEALELGPGNISLRTIFTSNSFQNSMDMFYMLEDMDKDWKPAPADGELNFNYLPPGKYILKVGLPGEHNQMIALRSLPINILPPFYRTWWFYLLVSLFLLALLFILDRERMKRKEKMHKMRTDIAEKLHREVNSALGNINILSEMALLKAEDEPSKSREFVEQIQEKSGTTLTAMEDMLWAITPGNDSMEKATNRMQEFLYEINSRGGASFDMVLDEQLKKMHFDMQWRYEVFLLFKETVQGVLQAGVKNCKVHVGYDKAELGFVLHFQNTGCDMQRLNNYFQSMKLATRVKGLNARLHLVQHKSNSEIECFIPGVLNP